MVSKERQDGYVDRVFRKGQSEAHIFDIKRLADVKALEKLRCVAAAEIRHSRLQQHSV